MAESGKPLPENDLSVDTTVKVFIPVTRDEKLITCGGITEILLNALLSSESVRGEGLALVARH
ncbi:hypothetical protein ACLK1T_03770 [Escherichia coli]